MSLSDFIQSLQTEDITYSTPTEPSIRVITPEKPQIRVIPPEKPIEENIKPKTIKIKLKAPVNKVEQTVTQPQVVEQPKVIEQPKVVEPQRVVEQPKVVEPPPYEPPKQVEPPKVEKKELTDEELFNTTGTEFSKKQLWLQYYEQAKNSRKQNPIVDRMKLGRFTITPDNKVLLLPDYDIVGKDPDDVLKDKWL